MTRISAPLLQEITHRLVDKFQSDSAHFALHSFLKERNVD
jgi:hypothetical protein